MSGSINSWGVYGGGGGGGGVCVKRVTVATRLP